MGISAIVIALVIAFVAWKVLTGIIKFALIAVLLVGTAWLFSQGGFA